MDNQNAFVQIFTGPGRPLRLETWELPPLGAGELLVKIELATICGSDLHTVAGTRQEATPCILGHEGVGRVVEVDSARKEVTIGDRITWSVADSCGACAACTDHDLPQKCHSLFKYGHADIQDGTGLNGCYASHIVLRRGTHIVKVPDHLSDAMVAPANCALATVCNTLSHLPPSIGTVVVQGAGLLGLYACAMLHERGVSPVFCVDIQEQRLAQVSQFGGIAVDGRSDHYPQSRKQITAVAPYGVDAVLEFAGVADLVPEGIRLLRPGGHYGFVGMVHPHSQLTLTGEQIIRKSLTIFGIHNYAPVHLDQAVEFLARTAHRYPYESLVSPPLTLTDLEKGFRIAQTQQWFRVSVQPDKIQ